MGDFGAGPPGDWRFTAGLVLFLAWPIVLAATGLLWGMAGAVTWVFVSVFIYVLLATTHD